MCIRDRGEPGPAFELLRDALNASAGRDPEIFAALGHVLRDLRRNDEARRALERALDSGVVFEGREQAERAYLELSGLAAAG